MIAAGFISFLASLLLVLFPSRIIANPLNEISTVAQRISVGDLNVNVATNGRTDEVGLLAQTFSRMTRTLQDMAGVAKQIAANDLRVQIKPQSDQDALGNAFATMVDTLRRTTAELSQGVNVLASSASAILA